MLNALASIIPLLRLLIQQKQNTLMAAEVVVLKRAAAATAREAAIAQRNADIIAAALKAQATPEVNAEKAEQALDGGSSDDVPGVTEALRKRR